MKCWGAALAIAKVARTMKHFIFSFGGESAALAKEDHFNSEDTPSTDNFLQLSAHSRKKLPEDEEDEPEFEYGDKEFHARDADSSDYSVHQFLTTDDGRDTPKSGDDEDQAFEMRS